MKGNESRIYKNAEKQAEEAGIKFGRLEKKKVVNGTLCGFFTQIEGEPMVYHWGYHSIFTTINNYKNGVTEDEVIEEEIEDAIEYEFEVGEVYETI
jgi:hypothetical protein